MKELSIILAIFFHSVINAQSVPNAYHNDDLRDVEYQGAYQSFDQVDYIVIEEDCRELYIYDHITQEELFHPEMHFQDASVKYYASSAGYVLCNFNSAFDVGNGDIMMLSKATGIWEPLILSERLEDGFHGYFIDWAPLDQDHFIFASSSWPEEELIIRHYSISENRLDTLFHLDQGDDLFLGIEYNDQAEFIYTIHQQSIVIMDLSGEVIESIELGSAIEKYSYQRNQFLLIKTEDAFYTLDARSNTFNENDFAFEVDSWSDATDSTVMYISRDPVDAVFEANVFTDDINSFRWLYVEENDFILPNFVDIFNIDGYVSGISMFKSTINNQIFAVSSLGDKVESYVSYNDITEWYVPSNDFSIGITDHSYFLDTTEVIEVNEDSLYYVVDTSIDFTYEIENLSGVDIDQLRVRSNATNMNGCGFLTYNRNLTDLALAEVGDKIIVRDTLDFIGRSGFYEFCIYAHSANAKYDAHQRDNQSCIEVPFDKGGWLNMVDPDINWYIDFFGIGTPPGPTYLYHYTQDTIWKKDKAYRQLTWSLAKDDSNQQSISSLTSLYRQYGPKVYRWDDDIQDEFLVYDFSLSVGDRFYQYDADEYSPYLEVVEKSTIQLDDGKDRIKLVLECGNSFFDDDLRFKTTWIEGLGDRRGPFVYDGLCVWDTNLSYIRCVSDEDGYIWQTGESCILLSTEEEPLNRISIFPNPSIDYLKIEGASNPLQWDIIDMGGTSLIKGTDLQIDISNLTSGIYIIKMTAEGNTPLYKRFIKI